MCLCVVCVVFESNVCVCQFLLRVGFNLLPSDDSTRAHTWRTGPAHLGVVMHFFTFFYHPFWVPLLQTSCFVVGSGVW